jgi:hypothetical protein
VAAYYTGGASEAYFQAKDNRQTVKTNALTNYGSENVNPQPTYTSATDPKMGQVVRLAPGVVAGGSMALRGAMRAASVYCRRYPMWCSSLAGGLGSVAQMVLNGQLPPVKRRRRKGISAGDLQRFRRVATFLHRWGPMAGSAAPRRTRRSAPRC